MAFGFIHHLKLKGSLYKKKIPAQKFASPHKNGVSSVVQLVCGLLTGMISSIYPAIEFLGFDSRTAHTLCNSTDW
jgi:hypothetical protein